MSIDNDSILAGSGSVYWSSEVTSAILSAIRGEHASRYAGKSAGEIADLLNSPWVEEVAGEKISVATSTAKAVLMATGEWAKLKLVALGAQEEPANVRGLAIIVHDALTELQTLGTDDPAYYAVIDSALSGLVGAGIIASATKDSLMALANGAASRIEHDAPVARLFVGLAGMPNRVSEDMIAAALLAEEA